MDYSYASVSNNNNNNLSNNSQIGIGARGGGFFPNLRAKQRESNLAQNGSHSVFPNPKPTRMIALPSLNDSNTHDESPAYFHTSSNQ